MAYKQFSIEDLVIHVYKRKGARSLRLSITAGPKIRVTIPSWAPYKAGTEFAKARLPWIRSQLSETLSAPLSYGQSIGKAHHIYFRADPIIQTPSARVSTTKITVTYPQHLSPTDSAVQQSAKRACIRALRSQGEALLPQRVATIAAQHGFEYDGVSIKQLKRRWGSCDQNGHLVFNLFLMQLPWEDIDYVILHELTHTRIMHHGPEFWQIMERVHPGAKLARTRMRSYRPDLAVS